MSEDCFTACFGLSLEPWPIPQASVILTESINGIDFLFIGLPDGSVGLRVIRNGIAEDYETDIIIPDGLFKFVASVIYSPLQPSIRINGVEISIGPLGSREKSVFTVRSQVEAIKEPVVLSHEVPEHATNAEALFIRTISELASASNSNDWYLLLKSSGHLRLLLLDGLLHKANENNRLKVLFRVADPGEPPPIDFDKMWKNIASFDLPVSLLTDLNLDQFLRLRVFESKNGEVTVKDVIRAAANADGGVHLDDPKQSEEELILSLDKKTQRFGQVASRHILRNICTVVVHSCSPLVRHIQMRA